MRSPLRARVLVLEVHPKKSRQREDLAHPGNYNLLLHEELRVMSKSATIL